VLNLNREVLFAQTINKVIRDLIEAAEPRSENFRQYLGLHFLLPFDAQLAQTMSDRAVMIIEATRTGELLHPGDWRCQMCSHARRCWR
jgi:hypothetical protein